MKFMTPIGRLDVSTNPGYKPGVAVYGAATTLFSFSASSIALTARGFVESPSLVYANLFVTTVEQPDTLEPPRTFDFNKAHCYATGVAVGSPNDLPNMLEGMQIAYFRALKRFLNILAPSVRGTVNIAMRNQFKAAVDAKNIDLSLTPMVYAMGRNRKERVRAHFAGGPFPNETPIV